MKKLILNLAVLSFFGMGVTLICSSDPFSFPGMQESELSEQLAQSINALPKKNPTKKIKPSAPLSAYTPRTAIEKQLIKILDDVKILSTRLSESKESPLSSTEAQKMIQEEKDKQAKLMSKARENAKAAGSRGGGRFGGGRSGGGGGSWGGAPRGRSGGFASPRSFGAPIGGGSFGGGHKAYNDYDDDDFFGDKKGSELKDQTSTTPTTEPKKDTGYSVPSESSDAKSEKASYDELVTTAQEASNALSSIASIKREKTKDKDIVNALEEDDAIQRLAESLRSLESKKSVMLKGEKLAAAESRYGGKFKSAEATVYDSLRQQAGTLMLVATFMNEENDGEDIDAAIQSTARTILKEAVKKKHLSDETIKQLQEKREATMAQKWDDTPWQADITAVQAVRAPAPGAPAQANIDRVKERNEKILALRKKLLPLPKHQGKLKDKVINIP